MKWVLFVYLVSMSSGGGITSTVNTVEFETVHGCLDAAHEIRAKIPDDAPLSFAICLAKE